MTTLFLVLGIGFGIVYAVILFMPSSVENMKLRAAIGFCFYGALISFLVFIYLSTRKILWTILAIPLIYLIQFILQMMSGAAIRAKKQQ